MTPRIILVIACGGMILSGCDIAQRYRHRFETSQTAPGNYRGTASTGAQQRNSNLKQIPKRYHKQDPGFNCPPYQDDKSWHKFIPDMLETFAIVKIFENIFGRISRAL